jgi:hypothetical protein
MLQQRLADLGDFEPMRAAFQEHRAHLLLEQPELAAQRGFGRFEARSRLADAARRDDLPEEHQEIQVQLWNGAFQRTYLSRVRDGHLVY